MFDWLRRHRRERLTAHPFPEAWRAHILRNMAHSSWLSPEEQDALEKLVQVFVAEKHWEGCGGLTLDDEIRVTIAAQACLLTLALPHDLYRNVDSILVYPSTVVPPERSGGVFTGDGLLPRGRRPVLGEAHLGGPVILAWDAVRCSGRDERGHNLVFHEFAHKLDMLDGSADGTPPLHEHAAYARWTEVCEREFLALRAAAERGQASLLDDYGSTDEAEFFAVATEVFFEKPIAMRQLHPELYEVLEAFFRQDPAGRRR